MDKILKLSACCLFVILNTLPAKAQQKNWQDVVYLKNGSIVKGYILSRDSGTVKILSYGDNVWAYPDSAVLRYEKQPPGKILNIRKRMFLENGFQSQVEAFTGIGNNQQLALGGRLINGYRFRHTFFTGLGVGINESTSEEGESYETYETLPVFIRFSADAFKYRNTPYAFADAGCQFNLNTDAKVVKPLFVRLGVGSKFVSAAGRSFTLSMAYRYNKMRYLYLVPSPSFYKTYAYSAWQRSHTLELTLGWTFL